MFISQVSYSHQKNFFGCCWQNYFKSLYQWKKLFAAAEAVLSEIGLSKSIQFWFILIPQQKHQRNYLISPITIATYIQWCSYLIHWILWSSYKQKFLPAYIGYFGAPTYNSSYLHTLETLGLLHRIVLTCIHWRLWASCIQ